MPKARRGERREAILHALALMLQEREGQRITTAELAAQVGVSEAALYRHFPSKARMFEGLLEFIEESIFTRINVILAEERDGISRLQHLVFLVLGFADKNPGMARILYGDVLTGETVRLRQRVVLIYDRLETQMKQILREAELREGLPLRVQEVASLLRAVVEGRIARFARSGFLASPTAGWDAQWELLCGGVFRPSPAAG